ncbi:formate dehydrogenase accessory sulfurtransferase FdhD [Basilea psittacipulmonis]|uniref:Sulfur carrier protein FdhD n=1 Tax=Basilea psittacipulmonis DSM 24701 TaxID=1072685 RepID=A0A077DGY8_9BURK|nr:formate dehydrogenase accessory sulfurtransferase FdhD [Basilea psittacipulmonis]AIL32702.1 hypothetical protein IX83_04715 [Basilea psittacipulmonis DSM 24701]
MNHEAIKAYWVKRSDASGLEKTETDIISCEVPIALVYNGISHVVLMGVAQDLEALAIGFSLSEQIVTRITDIYDIDIHYLKQGIELRIEISSACFHRLKERRRNLSGRTGCGLCGIDSLSQAVMPIQKIHPEFSVKAQAIRKAIIDFPNHQAMRYMTGSMHAAAWFDTHGQLQAIFEDLGRHNALDKLLGDLSQKHPVLPQGFILVSSRASYEMVAKSNVMGVSILVAVSAATSMAIDMADEAGMCLIGFARPDRFTIYTHAELVSEQ